MSTKALMNNYVETTKYVCSKLDHQDLINKIKIVESKLYRYSYIYPVIGVVNYDIVKKSKHYKIVVYKSFEHLFYDIKVEVIKHELCHIIDVHNNDNDICIENAGHGKTFKNLMHKISCNKMSCNIDDFQRLPYTLDTKKFKIIKKLSHTYGHYE